MDTKQIIIDAAFSLLEKRPFERITVQDILEAAHVSRGTFYKFFSDKYELMHLYYRAYMDRSIDENFNGHNWKEIAEKLLIFMTTKLSFFENVKDTDGQDSFWEFLRKYSYDFYSGVKMRNENRDFLTEREKLTIISHVDGSVTLLKMYIEKKISMSPDELAELICSTIPESYQEYRTLDTP